KGVAPHVAVELEGKGRRSGYRAQITAVGGACATALEQAAALHHHAAVGCCFCIGGRFSRIRRSVGVGCIRCGRVGRWLVSRINGRLVFGGLRQRGARKQEGDATHDAEQPTQGGGPSRSANRVCHSSHFWGKTQGGSR